MATGHRFELRVREDWLKRVTRRADALGITTSAFIKQAVNDALEPLSADGRLSVEALAERGPNCEHRLASVCPDCGGEETDHSKGPWGHDA